MRKLGAVLAAVLLVCFAAGCGTSGKPGQNQDKDKPRAGEKAE